MVELLHRCEDCGQMFEEETDVIFFVDCLIKAANDEDAISNAVEEAERDYLDSHRMDSHCPEIIDVLSSDLNVQVAGEDIVMRRMGMPQLISL